MMISFHFVVVLVKFVEITNSVPKCRVNYSIISRTYNQDENKQSSFLIESNLSFSHIAQQEAEINSN